MANVLGTLALTAEAILFPFPTYFFKPTQNFDAAWSKVFFFLNSGTILWIPGHPWGNRSMKLENLLASGHQAIDAALMRWMTTGFIIPDAHKASAKLNSNPIYFLAGRNKIPEQ